MGHLRKWLYIKGYAARSSPEFALARANLYRKLRRKTAVFAAGFAQREAGYLLRRWAHDRPGRCLSGSDLPNCGKEGQPRLQSSRAWDVVFRPRDHGRVLPPKGGSHRRKPHAEATGGSGGRLMGG